MSHTNENPREARALAIAAQQHGLVTRRQLADAGLSSSTIARWIVRGRLRPVHAGVYQLGPVEAPLARVFAATLACPDAAISHRTAAVLWQLLPPLEGDPIHLTCRPSTRVGRRPGIRAHRSILAECDVALLERIPLTCAARTLLDLGASATPRELEQAVATAERAGHTTRPALLTLLDRCPSGAGARALRRLLEASDSLAFTRSQAEERLLALLRASGLPQPEWNVPLHGVEVDCYWRREKLVIEVDGFAFHGSARAFVRDRQRDSALTAAGIRVLRLSWHQLERERDRTLAQIAQALARGAA